MSVAGVQKNSHIGKPILQASGLKKYFPVTKGLIFAKVTGWIKAVDGIDFTINRGDTFGLVGESGCGKTTTSRVILLEEKSTGGHILFNGEDISKLSGNELATYRRRVKAVFQDPYSSLNPRMKVSDIIGEPIVAQGGSVNKHVKERVAEVLNLVSLSQKSVSLYPHEFSGGQRQRIAVARALASSPQLIVLDEPVSALDVSIRAQILNLFRDLQERLGLTYFFIAHDLAAVKYMSTQIGVMYLGKMVESGESNELYARPVHPYTQALLASALPLRPRARRQSITVVKGEVPSLYGLPDGCRFHPRCPHAMGVCSEVDPPLKQVGSGHHVACHLSDRSG